MDAINDEPRMLIGNRHLPPGAAVEIREDDPRLTCSCGYCADWRERAAKAVVHPGTGKRYLYETH